MASRTTSLPQLQGTYIHNMGEASGKLLKLRLVAFRYKNDPAETILPACGRGAKVYLDGALFDAERPCCSTRSILERLLARGLRQRLK